VNIGIPFAMVLGGWIERRWYPRVSITLGSLMVSYVVVVVVCKISFFIQLCSGCMFLSYFTIQWGFIPLLMSYGIMFGTGLCFAYGSALVCATSVRFTLLQRNICLFSQWMPNNVGFAVGIMVAGFGSGSFVFSPIQTYYVNPNNYEQNKDG
jgi:hypothetical protein